MGYSSASFMPVEKGKELLSRHISQPGIPLQPSFFLGKERSKNAVGWGWLSGRLGTLTDSGDAREP